MRSDYDENAFSDADSSEVALLLPTQNRTGNDSYISARLWWRRRGGFMFAALAGFITLLIVFDGRFPRGSLHLRSRFSFSPLDLGILYSTENLAVEGQNRCFETDGLQYTLDWKAEGARFWDEWNYLTYEPNHGAAEYMTKQTAMTEGITAAFANHAILRPGPRGSYLKRTSAKLETVKEWKYFLMTMKYESIPWGCGIWPALWTHSPGVAWPRGGELDILEYTNELPSRTSFHVDAEANKCKLNPDLLNKPGCPRLRDAERNFTGHYDCVTDYPSKIGCAPNVVDRMANGQEMSSEPSVIAAEWTRNYAKIFQIPTRLIPEDLENDVPNPEGWDQWLISYYPFAASERTRPGTCPKPAALLQAQRIVISLGFCGDWASKAWIDSSCANKDLASQQVGPFSAKGPIMGKECVAVDPHNPKGEMPAGPRDCCTRFIYDENGAYGTDEYLAEHGFWNITWLKVYTHEGI